MTAENLLSAIGSVDEALLCACETYRPKTKRVWKSLAAAACIALAVAAVAAVLHQKPIPAEPQNSQPDAVQTLPAVSEETRTDASASENMTVPEEIIHLPMQPYVPQSSATQAGTPAIVTEKSGGGNIQSGGRSEGLYGGDAQPGGTNDPEQDALFEKAPITTKYPQMRWQGGTYTSRGNSDPASRVEQSIIGTAELTGFDGKHKMSVAILPLSGISTAAAVAVQFPDSDRCYTYISRSFAPATLGEYMDAFDLWNTMQFTGVSGCSEAYAAAVYPVPDQAAIRQLFDRSAKLSTEKTLYNSDMLLRANAPVLGFRGSFAVSKTGYVLCMIGDTERAYFIGAERAEAFLKTVDAGPATRLAETTAVPVWNGPVLTAANPEN